MDCVLFPNPSTYEEESSDSRLLAREREDLIGISAMRWLGKQKKSICDSREYPTTR